MSSVRDEAGNFAKGNPGGPGRPPRATERDYLIATTEACSVEDWQMVVTKAVEDAKAGDVKAREWLSNHLIGRAGERSEVLHVLAVEHAAGSDPAALDAAKRKDSDILVGLTLFGDL